MKYDFIIFGNSLSAVISAYNLVLMNKKVLIINQFDFYGGIFSPVKVGKYHFDPGMMLLEFSSFNKDDEVNPGDYDPTKKNDVGRFLLFVESYLSKFFDFHKISKPKMFFKGNLINDFLISNDFECLSLFNFSNKYFKKIHQSIFKENKKIHASHKVENNYNFSLYDSSLRNHGRLLNENIIEPFAKKVFFLSGKDLLAKYHRAGWLPLYYPETLDDAVNKKLHSLSTEFHYFANRNLSSITNFFLKRLKKSQLVSFLHTNFINSRIEFKKNSIDLIINKKLFKTNYVLNSLDPSIANIFFNNEKSNPTQFTKASLTCVYLLIEDKNVLLNFSVLNVVDKEYSVFRITNQSNLQNSKSKIKKISIEINPDYYENIYKSSNILIHNIIDELINMKLIKAFSFNDKFYKIKNYKGAIILPTPKNYKIFNRLLNKINNLDKRIINIGPSSGFLTSSLNDQIIQALKIKTFFNNEKR